MDVHPILFSGPMVRAILKGRKSQTRRVVTGMALDWLRPTGFTPQFVADPENGLCRYGYRGDRLWVRETWLQDGNSYLYKADFGETSEFRWKPSIHMPRKASRLTLEIVNLRIERLQDISRDDAKAEGVSNIFHNSPEHFERGVLNPYVANFSILWDKINAKRGFGWDVNPWVWVIEFKEVK